MWSRRSTRRSWPALDIRGFLALAICAQLGAAVSSAQEVGPGDGSEDAKRAWALLETLAGSWEGEIDGRLGTGKGVRRYEKILDGHFLVSRHRSVRMPQEKSTEGDQHGELGVFSIDSERKTVVYREFLNEGVAVRSPCAIEERGSDEKADEGKTIVCVSEVVESGPGIRARLTLVIHDRYRFTERYELAFPGRDLELYFTNEWRRTPLAPFAKIGLSD